ncbi:MAG TPA: RDD family protein [Solirubrobacteraceae bacterium]|nr:RDD family protein [Solirubrobacteraceae bacterium]
MSAPTDPRPVRLVDARRPVGLAGTTPPDRRPRSDAAAAQAAAILRLRGARAVPTAVASAGTDGDYAGLVTRAVALGLDAALINGSAALVAVVVGLAASILHLPSEAKAIIAAIGGAAWVLWTVAYFAFFWSTTGQTPGSRLMCTRVLDGRTRRPIGPLRAAARFGMSILAAIPLFAGYLIMLWDARRRCLQDRFARTVVVYAPAPRIGDRVLARVRQDQTSIEGG